MHIHLLDTSATTNNLGDEIIGEAIKSLLYAQFPTAYYTRSSSHDGIGPVSRARASRADIAFLLGTNALSPTWLEPGTTFFSIYEQDLPVLGGKVVLLGVGAMQADVPVEPRQKQFLSQLLSRQYRHAVRDESAANIVADCGMDSIRTSCPTLWNLHAERGVITFPPRQCENVCFSLTHGARNPVDIEFVNLLRRRYKRLYFWPQLVEDIQDLRAYHDTSDIHIVPPNLQGYSEFLRTTDCDVIGTRLHGSIYGLRHGRRCVVLTTGDHRARQIGQQTGLPVIERNHVCERLEGILSQPISMDFSEVDRAAKAFFDQFTSGAEPAPTYREEVNSFLPGGGARIV